MIIFKEGHPAGIDGQGNPIVPGRRLATTSAARFWGKPAFEKAMRGDGVHS
jgi:hypothetical protein